MSVSEDEKLCQMIRDYIENDPTPPPKAIPVDYQSSFDCLQEVIDCVTVSEAEILGKICMYWKDLEARKLRKWMVMKLGMDKYEASICRTSWLTKTIFTHPSVSKFTEDYEYIEVMKKGDEDGDEGVRLIVDVDFRSQFELSKPTQEYQELSNCLPRIFVGSVEKLEKIISLVCPAAKKSLRERGLHIPPWRKARYMHSKWLSKDCKRISFSDLEPISFSDLEPI